MSSPASFPLLVGDETQTPMSSKAGFSIKYFRAAWQTILWPIG